VVKLAGTNQTAAAALSTICMSACDLICVDTPCRIAYIEQCYNGQPGSQRRMQPEYVERQLSGTAVCTSNLLELVESATDDGSGPGPGRTCLSRVHRVCPTALVFKDFNLQTSFLGP